MKKEPPFILRKRRHITNQLNHSWLSPACFSCSQHACLLLMTTTEKKGSSNGCWAARSAGKGRKARSKEMEETGLNISRIFQISVKKGYWTRPKHKGLNNERLHDFTQNRNVSAEYQICSMKMSDFLSSYASHPISAENETEHFDLWYI